MQPLRHHADLGRCAFFYVFAWDLRDVAFRVAQVEVASAVFSDDEAGMYLAAGGRDGPRQEVGRDFLGWVEDGVEQLLSGHRPRDDGQVRPHVATAALDRVALGAERPLV